MVAAAPVDAVVSRHGTARQQAGTPLGAELLVWWVNKPAV